MRYIEEYVKKDLQKKMVFISGPRQTGKTTFVKEFLKQNALESSLYLNWDDIDDRKIIQKREWSLEKKIVALDEIHKFSKWKNFLKGTFDTQKENHNFIVTGSSRLDIYKKGQDSMMGRFFSWRLHPLCLSELKHCYQIEGSHVLQTLIEHSGFPEPFFSGDITFTKRWRKERINLIFRQDIKELENIRDIFLLENFYLQLSSRVGSEIVLSNIARDLEISPNTAKKWLSILEKTYSVFIVPPYVHKSIAKAITKPPKVYFYDNGEVDGDIGAKFENLVANHLYKKIHFLEDATGDNYGLHYLRDRNQHEVDFLISKNRKPFLMIECKTKFRTDFVGIHYYMNKFHLKRSLQLTLEETEKSTFNNITVMSAREFLSKSLLSDFNIENQ